MAIWILKAVVQKGISFLPASHKVNYLFQKHITKGVNLSDDLFEDKLKHCAEHLSSLRELGSMTRDFIALELGTGWFPIVPVGLWLCGAREVFTIDLTPLLREDNIETTFQKFATYAKDGRLNVFLPGIIPSRLEKIIDGSFSDLSQLNIVPVNGDARKMDFKNDVFDLICSNNVFEHIPRFILLPILKEFRRVGKEGSAMSHFVDMSDHFSHLDKNISIYNFLKYSASEWKWIDNSVQPQNRMRIYDFRDLYKEAGITISKEINRPGDAALLAQIRLAAPYRDQPADLTAISHTLLMTKL